MSNITKFYPANAADSADMVLEQAMGEYEQVLLIGKDAEGGLDFRATNGVTDQDAVFLVEGFKHLLLTAAFEEDD